MLCALSLRSWGANICIGREGIAAEEAEERGRGSAETMWCEEGSMLRDGERCIADIIMGPSTLIVGLSGSFEGGAV